MYVSWIIGMSSFHDPIIIYLIDDVWLEVIYLVRVMFTCPIF